MTEKKIFRLEELKGKEFHFGDKVIIEDEVMRFAGVHSGGDIEIGDYWTDPVFLQETKDGKYKAVTLLTKCSAGSIFIDIIGKDSKNYSQVKEIWEKMEA